MLWSPENGSGIFALGQASRVILLQDVEDYDFSELCVVVY